MVYLRHDVIINNLIAWGLPTIFTTVALASHQIAYVTSHYCGPTLAKGPALVWIPGLTYLAIALCLVIWTLIEVYRVRNSSIISVLSLRLGVQKTFQC